MNLDAIYRPIRKELKAVEGGIAAVLARPKEKSFVDISRFLLKSPGKRLRPALLLLAGCAAARPSSAQRKTLIDAASAIELIHMASLIHDDTIDKSTLRHHRPTINSRWGTDASIVSGDYLHALAFELLARSASRPMLLSMGVVARLMCEGEMMQIRARKSAALSRAQYLLIIEKKTANLFATSCGLGGRAVAASPRTRRALENYGLNIGMAFQIVDDYRDLAATKEKLGKMPGQDIAVGELTLPLLNLFEAVDRKEAACLRQALKAAGNNGAFEEIRRKIRSLNIASRIRAIVLSYVRSAQSELVALRETPYRRSLMALADFIGDFH